MRARAFECDEADVMKEGLKIERRVIRHWTPIAVATSSLRLVASWCRKFEVHNALKLDI